MNLCLNVIKQVVLYATADGKVTVNVMFFQETFWMTQRTLADLFDVNIPAISKHLKNIGSSKIENTYRILTEPLLNTYRAESDAFRTFQWDKLNVFSNICEKPLR